MPFMTWIHPLFSLRRACGACMALLLTVLLAPPPAQAARVKDIAHVQGVRANQLIGYGLVVGLDNTGDVGRAELTVQTISSMLSRMNIKIDQRLLMPRNVAAVVVTAEVGAFARSGQRLDVTVSSLGNARSLQGGTLLMTPLSGADGAVYALGQGPLSVGGYEAVGAAGNRVVKNHLNVGRVPQGAMVEQEVGGIDLSKADEVRLNLFEPDFATAVRVARAISALFDPQAPSGQAAAAAAVGIGKPGTGVAKAVDATTIVVRVPPEYQTFVPQFIAALEAVEVERDMVAKIVINERTGTVVMGGSVRVKEVAVAHGDLRVSVDTTLLASQPAPFARQGTTQVVPNSEVQATEGAGQLHVVGASASIGDVVSALNALGVTPRDLIAILQAMKSAGAIDARLEIL